MDSLFFNIIPKWERKRIWFSKWHSKQTFVTSPIKKINEVWSCFKPCRLEWDIFEAWRSDWISRAHIPNVQHIVRNGIRQRQSDGHSVKHVQGEIYNRERAIYLYKIRIERKCWTMIIVYMCMFVLFIYCHLSFSLSFLLFIFLSLLFQNIFLNVFFL